MKKIVELLTWLFIAFLLSTCQTADRAEVMSEVTLRLLMDSSVPVKQQSYQIKFHNHNTRVSTIRNSISTSSYSDQLLRGLYDVQVEGTLLLENGERAWVRGSATEQEFLSQASICEIHLVRMQ